MNDLYKNDTPSWALKHDLKGKEKPHIIPYEKDTQMNMYFSIDKICME